MVLPALAAGTLFKALGGIAIEGATSVIGDAVRITLKPIDRTYAYQGEAKFKNLLPNPEQISRLWYADVIDNDLFQKIISRHGINWNGDYSDTKLEPMLWNRVMHMNKPRPGVESYRKWWLQKRFSDDVYKDRLRVEGIDIPSFWPLLANDYENIDLETLLTLNRRGVIDDGQLKYMIQALGFINPGDADNLITLKWEVPTTSDILLFLQRNVFDAQYVQDYELMEGFATRFWPTFGQQLTANGMTQQTAEYHYAAHWINPADTKLKELLWRLRPGVVDPSLEFTIHDYERVLVEQDVAPYFRRRYVATAYNVPALSYVKEWYYQGVINETTLAGYHQSLGFTATDSDNFVAIDRIQKARTRASGGHGWTPQALANAYSVGLITDSQVDAGMATLGYTSQEAQQLRDRAGAELQRTITTRARSKALMGIVRQVKNGIDVGTLAANDAIGMLVTAGFPLNYATAIVNMELAAAAAMLSKQVIATTRSAYLAGEINPVDATNLLISAGIQNDRTQQYIAAWLLQNTPNRKRRTASQIVNDVATNQLPLGDAKIRLANLGYNTGDINLYVADINAKIQTLKDKALKAQLKEDRATAKALADAIKQAKAIERKANAKLRKIAPPAKLLKWVKLGIISTDLAKSRLELMGYPDQAIQAYIDEACASKGAACVSSPQDGEITDIGPVPDNINPATS